MRIKTDLMIKLEQAQVDVGIDELIEALAASGELIPFRDKMAKMQTPEALADTIHKVGWRHEEFDKLTDQFMWRMAGSPHR